MEPASHPSRTGPFRVLAISGSLRAASGNLLMLRAAQVVAPPELHIELYRALGELPHFNPDIDNETDRPAVVCALRARVASADALLISSPEYAHGVPGSLKNALDWLVSGPEFPAIPVALLNPSPRATHAQAALAETVRTMSGEVLSEASAIVPLSGRPLTLEEVLSDPPLADPIRKSMSALAGAIIQAREAGRRLVP